MTTTIEILREDFRYTIPKADVWLVYTTKSNRPWICVPNGVEYKTDTVILTLATGGNNND